MPPFVHVYAGGVSVAPIPLRGVLLGIALRFRGKRFQARDLHGILLHTRGLTLWRSDAACARMLEMYRDGRRPVRGYVFVDLTDPHAPVGGLNLARVDSVDLQIEIGPLAVDPRVEWWSVLL